MAAGWKAQSGAAEPARIRETECPNQRRVAAFEVRVAGVPSAGTSRQSIFSPVGWLGEPVACCGAGELRDSEAPFAAAYTASAANRRGPAQQAQPPGCERNGAAALGASAPPPIAG